MIALGGKKQVLVVGNDAVQLYVVQNKRISLYAEFSSTEENLGEELKKSFKSIGSSLTILVDVVEQQYRKEAIPAVSFFDKQKVIDRKLTIAFPQQQMRAAVPLRQKPRDGESMVALFTALSETPLFTTIIGAVIDSEVFLSGIGLLPLEATNLVEKLVKALHERAKTENDTRWSVLMTPHKSGGLRQIVIKDGDLALTRMTPLSVDPRNVTEFTEEMIREFNATLTYLLRFGYVASDGLDLIMVSSPDVCQKVREYRLPVTHLYPLTPGEAGQLIDIIAVIDHYNITYGEIVHAAWNGVQSKLFVPLVSPIIKKVKSMRQMARAGIILLCFAIGYLAYVSVTLKIDSMTLESNIAEKNARRVALQHETDELSKKLNTLKHDPEKTRVTLSIHDEFANKNMDPEPMFKAIMSQMDRDKVHIKDISIVAEDGVMSPSPTPGGAPAAQPPGSVPGMGAPGQPAADETPKPPKPSVTMHMTIAFNEELTVEDAARETNAFQQRLKTRLPGRDIAVDTMVGNLALDKAVEGVSEQLAEGKVEGRLVKSQTSSFTIKGALE